MNTLQARMIRYAEAHGFVAVAAGDSAICIIIPWVHVDTREEGEDRIDCATWPALRAALGY